jgi:hypothetical protein
MIFVKIDGGLGNQLFQYSAAYALAKKLQTDICLEISFYDKNDLLSIIKNIIKKVLIITAHFLRIKLRIIERFRYIENYPRQLYLDFFSIPKEQFCRKLPSNIKIYEEKNFSFDINYFNIKDNTYIKGGWQSEKYFFHERQNILKLFHLKTPVKLPVEIETQKNTVSIHVRRGDYLLGKSNNYIGVLDLDYYKNAIEIINTKIKEPFYILFSDSPEWCEMNFIPLMKNQKFIFFKSKDKNSSLTDFYTMLNCQHQIVANSSYSWWAAWLNQNPEKIVIAPAKPFSDSFPDDYTDYYPESWIKC